MQANPQAAVLPVNVSHGHTEGGADAGERKKQTDQRPVAQTDDDLGVDGS
jgi:hypothetical protein